MDFHKTIAALVVVPILMVFASSTIAGGRGGQSPSWAYRGEKGPAHWASLSDEFAVCASGQAQSPVDVGHAQASRLAPLAFHYRSNVLSLRNDDNGLILGYDPGSFVRIGPTRFELTEVRFHAPAEHSVGGRREALEIQLMHRDEAGRQLGVSVWVRAGVRTNSILERLAEHIPQGDWDRYENGQIGINATFLLPSRRSYFTYVGSLTTPPCTEGVRWIVFNSPLEARPRDVRRLSEFLAENARPVQPLNQRRVLESR